MQTDAASLTAILGFIPMANQKLAALHQKAAANVPLTPNEQAYLQRIKQVPALIKLELVVPPPAQLTVLADGTVGFQGATLSLVELGPKLKDFVANTYDPSLVVTAGTGATYANFQAAMKAGKDAGVPHLTTEGAVPAAPEPPKPLDFAVQADGTIKYQNATISLDDAGAKIKAAASGLPVTIRPDPRVSYVKLKAIVVAARSASPNNVNVVLLPAEELTVTAHGDGTILFHGVSVSIDDFRPDIQAAVEMRPELPVVVHSNPKLNYAAFTAIVDACKNAQAKKLTLVPPTPQPPPPPAPPKPLDVAVHSDGTIKFQGAAMQLDEFTAKIKDALAAHPDAAVTVHPDAKVSYVALTAIVDACKNAPAKNFSLVLPAPTEPLTVAARADGTILFHNAALNLDAFRDDIKAAVALRPDAPVVLHSNPKMDYAKFQAVADACNAAGAKQVTIVQPAPQPPAPAPATPAAPVTAETPPAAASSPAEGKPAAPLVPLSVVAHADGSIKFQGKTMKIDEFTAKVKDAVAANPDLAVVIHSNPKMDYAKFEAVVDACKNAPVKEVAVVQPAPQPPATPAVPAVAAMPETPAVTVPTTPPMPAPPKPVEPATVLVHEDGSVGFLGQRGTMNEFKTKLAKMVQTTPDRELVIKASSKKVPYDHVKAVLDACADAHVTHVNVTVPPPAPATAETPAPASPATAETPPASTLAPAPVNTKPVPAQIDLAADGSLTLDGTTVTEDDLKTRLANIKASNPKNPLVMMKQPGVTKEQWMHFVDLAHTLGLKLLVKNAKAPAIAPMVATPATLRPSAAEGGSPEPAEPAPHLSTTPAPESTAPSTNAPPAISSTEESVPVEIELTPDGLIAFLGETVSDAELQSRLDTVAHANLKEPVLIVKDEKVTHEQLQHVLDMCRAARLKTKVKVVKSSDTGALKPHANLPLAIQPPPAAGSEKVLPVEIGLGTKGRLTFEGTPVSLDELKARLATVAKGNPDQPVVIVKAADVTEDSADALVTVCQGVSAQLKVSVKTAPSFAPSLPDNSPADNLPSPDVHLHASLESER